MAKKTEPTAEPMTVHTSNTGNATTDHEVIRKWAEERGGKPATVEGTERGGDDVGLIRLEFPDAPGANDSKLTEITWDEWFAKFDEGGLALLYQEHTADGQPSSFNKLVKQETAAMATAEPVRTAAKKAAAKKTPAAKKATAKKAPPAKTGATKTATTKTAAKKAVAKKVPVSKKASVKKAPPSKASVAKKGVAKTTAKNAPVAKKATAKKSSRKVPAARGYRGR